LHKLLSDAFKNRCCGSIWMCLGSGKKKSRRGLGGVSRDFAKVGELTGIDTAKRSWDGTECLGAVGKRDCNKLGRYQRGVEGSGFGEGWRRRGWGCGIRSINGAGEALAKRGIWMREKALSVISWDDDFVTPSRADPSPSHISIISQAGCYLQQAASLCLTPPSI